jgi:hypothetical protein
VSPFRYVFREAGVKHPVGYSLVLAGAAMIVCMMAAVCISLKASERAIRISERGQCDTLQADVDAYREEPPRTAAGIHQLRSKQERLKALGCPGPTP